MKIPFKSFLLFCCSIFILFGGCSSSRLQSHPYSAETATDDPVKGTYIDFSFNPLRDKLAVAITGTGARFRGILIENLTDGRILQKFESCCASKPVWSADGRQLFFMAFKKDLKKECGQDLSPEAFSKLVRENTLVYKYESGKFIPVVDGMIVFDIMYSKVLQSLIFTGMEEFLEPSAGWDDWEAKRRPDLWTIGSSNQQPLPLTSEGSIEGKPIISDDGMLVFYNLYLPREEKNVQFVLNLQTMEKKSLDLGRFFNAFLALSEDKRYLLFTKNPIIGGEVKPEDRCYVYDLEKQEQTEVLGEECDVSDGNFLENGKTLVLSAKDRGEKEFSIWIMRNGPGSPTKIMTTGATAQWNGRFERYDETNISFTDNQSIYVMDIATGEKRVLYSVPNFPL